MDSALLGDNYKIGLLLSAALCHLVVDEMSNVLNY